MNGIGEGDLTAAGRVYRPLRIWGPVIFLILMVISRLATRFIEDGPSNIWMVPSFVPAILGIAILLWWLLVSRATWIERLLGGGAVLIILVLEQLFCHPSMRLSLLVVMTIPMVTAGFAIGFILLNRRQNASRTWLAVVLAVLAGSVSLLVKTDGVWGDFSFDLQPRWQQSQEEKLLASTSAATPLKPSAIEPQLLEQQAWPIFRGPNQNGKQHGISFSADWSKHPPQELWRIPIGPAWSSFVVAGNYLFTQEQRGQHESVTCYEAMTGNLVWVQQIPSRFFESLGGLGPRSTPTIHGTDLYAQGAEGFLLKLDATNGQLMWQVDLRELSGRKDPPMWGFSASPLVYDDLLIAYAGAKEGKGVLALKTEDGSIVWTAAAGEHSYGSPQMIKLFDQELVFILSEQGAHGWQPLTGRAVFEHRWPHDGYRALQPQLIDGNKLLIGTGLGTGTRLLQLNSTDGAITEQTLWSSRELKPDFNDFVVHRGFIYGFDDRVFSCVDMETGKRRWRGGRYEKGQALLLADSDLIVVVSESGELVLLQATPEKLEELAKIPALNGKTWNHPVVVEDRLYLRNANEAVCYRLPKQDQ